jgi:FkbM family methyltransferase
MPWLNRLLQELRLRPTPDDVRADRADNKATQALLRSVLTRDSNCIDVGAHTGHFLKSVVKLAPTGEHIAFEPLPDMAEELRGRFPAVEVHEVALSDRSGTAEFQHVVSNPGYSGFRRRSYVRPDESIETIQVEVRPLDDIVPVGRRVDFMKVDVEGAELEVLRGARRILSSNKPYVVFEHGQGGAPHYGTTPEDVFDLLVGECGLAIHPLRSGPAYDREGFRAAYDDGQHWNFVACSRGSLPR